jgi:hypothetical protein
VIADAGDADHPTILAQNADTMPNWHGHQVLLRIQPSAGQAPALLVMTYPGLVGPYGLNRDGIGICVNALFRSLNNTTAGLCTPFVARGVLARRTFDEAADFIHAVPHASGNALTIGAPGRVAAFEVSAGGVVPWMLPGSSRRTSHTNHVLVSDDRQSGASPEANPNSVARMEMVEAELASRAGALTAAGAKALLSTHGETASLCRHEDDAHGSMTTYSMVMELDHTPRLHVAPGPPCRTPYQVFDVAEEETAGR